MKKIRKLPEFKTINDTSSYTCKYDQSVDKETLKGLEYSRFYDCFYLDTLKRFLKNGEVSNISVDEKSRVRKIEKK